MRYLIPAALLACSSAHAVPYTLPSGPDVAQALLSGPLPSYAVVCDSRSGVPCDVEPGRYQLQVFDQNWSGTRSRIVVEGPPAVGGAPSVTLVSERCEVDQSRIDLLGLVNDCIASCPSGAVATGGACRIEGAAISDAPGAAAMAAEALVDGYRCRTTESALERDLVDRTLVAEVYCLQ